LKRIGSTLAVLILSALLPAAAATAAEIKIGVVNAQKILEQAPQVEAARTRLEKEFSPRDRALASTQKELKRLEEKLARNSAVMSDIQRRDLERQIRDKQRDLDRDQQEFREDFNLRRNEEFDKIQKQVFQAIADLAKDEKYDLVLGDGVIYASQRMDITDRVLQRLKKTAK
jgi:outer membrane protein